ncbi:MAG: hypothetical protein J6A40_11380, partial [Bacteroides sp.]|nr:hypothetical protein [Bacteroides sp.]
KILTQINKMGGGVKIPTSSACCVAIHNPIIPLTSITGRFAAFIPMQQAALFVLICKRWDTINRNIFNR